MSKKREVYFPEKPTKPPKGPTPEPPPSELDAGSTAVSREQGYDPLGWNGIRDIKLMEFITTTGNWKVSMDGNGMTLIAADNETKEALRKFNEQNQTL